MVSHVSAQLCEQKHWLNAFVLDFLRMFILKTAFEDTDSISLGAKTGYSLEEFTS